MASLPCGLLKLSDCQLSNILPLSFTLQYCLIPSFVIICDVKWKCAKYTIPHSLKLMHLSLFTKFVVPHFCSCITGRNCWHSDSFHIIKVLPIRFMTAFSKALWVSSICKLIGPSNIGIAFLPVAKPHEKHFIPLPWNFTNTTSASSITLVPLVLHGNTCSFLACTKLHKLFPASSNYMLWGVSVIKS